MNTKLERVIFAVIKARDYSAGYWIPEYDSMAVEELRSARRERAIGCMVSTLCDHYTDDKGDYVPPSIHELATVLIDASDWARWGFDAVLTEPKPWWRFWR